MIPEKEQGVFMSLVWMCMGFTGFIALGDLCYSIYRACKELL